MCLLPGNLSRSRLHLTLVGDMLLYGAGRGQAEGSIFLRGAELCQDVKVLHVIKDAGLDLAGGFVVADTVDGSEIRRAPVDMVNIPLHIFKVLCIPGGCLGFLPSTVVKRNPNYPCLNQPFYIIHRTSHVNTNKKGTKSNTWQFFVTFLVWLSDPLNG